ncbi:unnamed protein product, partial [Phaedon cochleariae]
QHQPATTHQFQAATNDQYQPGTTTQHQPGTTHQFQAATNDPYQPGTAHQFQATTNDPYQPGTTTQHQPGMTAQPPMSDLDEDLEDMLRGCVTKQKGDLEKEDGDWQKKFLKNTNNRLSILKGQRVCMSKRIAHFRTFV